MEATGHYSPVGGQQRAWKEEVNDYCFDIMNKSLNGNYIDRDHIRTVINNVQCMYNTRLIFYEGCQTVGVGEHLIM